MSTGEYSAADTAPHRHPRSAANDGGGRTLLAGLRALAFGRFTPRVVAQWFAGVLPEFEALFLDDGYWRAFVDGLRPNHIRYDADRSRQEKMRLFKVAVSTVEFEPHAYCNRQCTFCPNAVATRQKNHAPMDFPTYERIIGELADIEYAGRVRFARYSEPLACENICDYLSVARRALPDAEIDIITNGDYLNEELLGRLADAGLDVLRISVYPKGYSWNIDNVLGQLGQISKRIGLEPEITHRSETAMHWCFPYHRFGIFAFANDFNVTGFDRGQSLEYLIDRDWVRRSPCAMVFNNVTIDFNGAVMPCCNFRSDLPGHEKHVVDRLKGDKSIFDVYTSEMMTEWRRNLAHVGPKSGACATCKQKTMNSGMASFFLQRKIKRRLGNMIE